MNESTDNDGLDIAGFGKIAKAIPPKVYERSATTLLTAFQQITAPITETTSGLGRYLRQKFDNMVEAEKATGKPLCIKWVYQFSIASYFQRLTSSPIHLPIIQ